MFFQGVKSRTFGQTTSCDPSKGIIFNPECMHGENCIEKYLQPSEGVCVIRRNAPKLCNFGNRQCNQGEICIWDPSFRNAVCIEPARVNGGDQGEYFELFVLNLDR